MALRLDDRWVWDFWHVHSDGNHHLFYLQAPRSLGDPDRRHWHASIGHAVSRDLERWAILPDALHPGAAGTWDDFTTWTGSIIEHDGRWHLLYTGTSHAESGLVQRVGLATSDDLVTWERHGDTPVIEADPRWYETLDLDVWHDQAWRDPWVVRDAAGGFRAYLTARAATGDGAGRGVIGQARSDDLVAWEVLPPVTEPFGIGQLEVPQLVEVEGAWHLLFCTEGGDVAQAGTGTYALVGPSPEGPFAPSTLYAVDAHCDARSYAGRIVATGSQLAFLSWSLRGPDGVFVGEIPGPRRVSVNDGGMLSVAAVLADTVR